MGVRGWCRNEIWPFAKNPFTYKINIQNTFSLQRSISIPSINTDPALRALRAHIVKIDVPERC